MSSEASQEFIFVLDDSRTAGETVRRVIAKKGYFSRAFQTIDELEKQLDELNMVGGFVDFSMPDIKADVAIKRLLDKKPDLKIYGLTGTVNQKIRDLMVGAGALDCLDKNDVRQQKFVQVLTQISEVTHVEETEQAAAPKKPEAATNTKAPPPSSKSSENIFDPAQLQHQVDNRIQGLETRLAQILKEIQLSSPGKSGDFISNMAEENRLNGIVQDVVTNHTRGKLREIKNHINELEIAVNQDRDQETKREVKYNQVRQELQDKIENQGQEIANKLDEIQDEFAGQIKQQIQAVNESIAKLRLVPGSNGKMQALPEIDLEPIEQRLDSLSVAIEHIQDNSQQEQIFEQLSQVNQRLDQFSDSRKILGKASNLHQKLIGEIKDHLQDITQKFDKFQNQSKEQQKSHKEVVRNLAADLEDYVSKAYTKEAFSGYQLEHENKVNQRFTELKSEAKQLIDEIHQELRKSQEEFLIKTNREALAYVHTLQIADRDIQRAVRAVAIPALNNGVKNAIYEPLLLDLQKALSKEASRLRKLFVFPAFFIGLLAGAGLLGYYFYFLQ